MEQRIEFVVRVARGEASISALCEEHGISRQAGHYWLRRYRAAESFTALQTRSRRPHHCPSQTAQDAELAVERVRRQYGWGARKIQLLLAEEGVVLTEPTINRILRRRGLIAPREVQGQATGRFARVACNQLWQMDFKGEYQLVEGKCYPLMLVDDHSRYLLGLWPLPNQRAEGVKAALQGCFREGGVPQELLLDRGVPWWSTTNGHGLTQLSVWVMKQDVALIYGRPYHPQTHGKVERLNRTLKERTKLEGAPADLPAWQEWGVRFEYEYNHVRPHEALGMGRPAQVYTRANLRPYQEQPLEYDYGQVEVRRLNGQGCVTHGNRRYFVCEALANERVRVDEVDHLLVVAFRATAVREIDLRTGRSRALLRPAQSARMESMS
jgi:transposase InsO family protein